MNPSQVFFGESLISLVRPKKKPAVEHDKAIERGARYKIGAKLTETRGELELYLPKR